MICERCPNEGPDVTDLGACMVAHCWECLATCAACQSDMNDQGEL